MHSNIVRFPAALSMDHPVSLRMARDSALRAAREAVRDTTRLTRLLTILSEPGPLSLVLDRVLSMLSELFCADVVVLLDPAGTGTFAPLAAIGLPEDMLELPFSDEEQGHVQSVIRAKTPVLADQAATDPKVDSQLRELGVETMVGLPVGGNHAAEGVLLLGRCRPEPFASTDVDLLLAMTHRIGLALEEAQRNVQFELIVQSNRVIGQHLEITVLAGEAVHMLPRIVGADASALILRDGSGSLRCEAHTGLVQVSTDTLTQLAGYLISSPYLEKDEPFGTTDLTTLLLEASLPPTALAPVRTLLAVPLHHQELIRGVLFALRSPLIAYPAHTQQMAMLYGGQISAALVNAHLYQAVCRELFERMRAEKALRTREERFSALIRSVSDIIAVLSVDGDIDYVSPAAEAMWGCAAATLQGRSVLDHVHAEDRTIMQGLLVQAGMRPGLTLNGVVRLRQGKGGWRYFEVVLVNLLDDPAISGMVATYHDVTERKVYESELTKLAFHDPLTGLANRACFMNRLRRALTRADAQGLSVAVFFFDLDNFKQINDTLGHACGDQVLRLVADRVQGSLRREDTAARLGGDEFTVLVEGVSTLEQVLPLAERVLHSLQTPFSHGGHELLVGGSMGVALSVPNVDSAEDLVRKADLAMYRAKNSGKGKYTVFAG